MRRFIPLLIIAAFCAACEPKIDTPEQETPDTSSFSVDVTSVNGVIGKDGPVSYPRFTVVIDGPDAMYTIQYTLDDKSATLKNVYAGEPRTVTVSDADGVGGHSFHGKVTRNATGEEVSFEAEAWMRWPPLSEAKGSYSTIKSEPTAFSTTPITVDKNLILTVNVEYKDPVTPVEAVAYNHSSVSVKSFEKASDGRASMVVVPSAKTDEGWFGMILVNGNLRDTLVQKFVCTGEEAQGQMVQDFSIEGFEGTTVSLPMKTTLSFAVNPEPKSAVDAGEVSVESSKSEVFTVSKDGAGWTIRPVWPGTAVMKVTVGNVQKEYTVNVTGTPVSDFKIGSAFSTTEWFTGTQVTDFITPIPASAFDADEMNVKSLSPNIISVTNGSSGEYTFKALSYGKATVEISTGHCSRKIEITVKEDLDLSDFGRAEIPWGESLSFVVKGHYSDFFVNGSLDKDIQMVRSGNILVITNNIHKSATANKRSGKKAELSFKTGDGTVFSTTVSLGGVTNNLSRTFTVNPKENSTEIVFRFKNGFDYALSYETMEGYVMSSAGESANTVDFYEKIQQGRIGGDFSANGKLYARYYNFVKEFTGERDGWVNFPPMDITEYRIVINATGDDFGSYKNGTGVYMVVNKSIYPEDKEEWYW